MRVELSREGRLELMQFQGGRRCVVEACYLTMCENGHVVEARPIGRRAMVACDHCDQLTWADGNYCISCGGKLE